MSVELDPLVLRGLAILSTAAAPDKTGRLATDWGDGQYLNDDEQEPVKAAQAWIAAMVPPTIVVSEETFETLTKAIEQPREPIEALVSLFRRNL